MWLVTKQGFYSVVQHRAKPDTFLVRARARKDLTALKKQVPGLKIKKSEPTADYGWRAEVKRDVFLAAMVELGEGIDYDNFKNAVARRDKKRSYIYMGVWSRLLEIQGRWTWRRPFQRSIFDDDEMLLAEACEEDERLLGRAVDEDEEFYDFLNRSGWMHDEIEDWRQ